MYSELPSPPVSNMSKVTVSHIYFVRDSYASNSVSIEAII